MGTAKTTKTFTTADLRGLYTSMFRPDNAMLLAVGDITADKVMPLFEKSFGAWKASGAAATEKLPAVEPPATRQVFVIDKPGAPQSQIRIRSIGLARPTADHFPLTGC